MSDWTSILFEKISGISETPTASCFAVRNGDWLKAGSSAMETSSTVTPPEKIESLMLPMETLRPERRCEIGFEVGLNWFASMKSGSAIITITSSRTTAPTTIRAFFMSSLRGEDREPMLR